MPAEFLHGVETIAVTQGARPVRDIRSAVIAVVGTAPMGAVNQLTLCLNPTDDAQFGAIDENSIGYTIPAALKAERDCGASAILVVNVLDADAEQTPDDIGLTDLIGSTDVNGIRTGLQLLYEGYGLYGFDARIIIVPSYSSAPAVTAAMEVIANALKAVAYFDLPIGLTRNEAIQARSGSVLGLTIHQTSSDRIRPCYPHVKVFDAATEQNVLEPLSIRAAGVRARTDREIGYWTSSSNKTLSGVIGLERVLTSRIDDADSDVNNLNAAGLTTVFRDWGTGFRLWGNRNASFPTSTAPENFEQVRRTRDMIEEALHQASLPFIDIDIGQPEIDSIVETGDAYMRSLFQRNAIVGGKVWFDASRTPPTDIANGQLRVQYKFTPKYPNERLTYESEVTNEYLLNLRSTNTGGA